MAWDDSERVDMESYEAFVHGVVRHLGYSIPGADYDDLIQEARLGLLRAIRTYDPSRGNFKSFASLCIRASVNSAIKAATAYKHEVLTKSARLSDSTSNEEGEEDLTWGDMLPDRRMDTVDLIQARNTLDSTLGQLETLPVAQQRAVVGMAIGMSYKELAVLSGSTEKAVDLNVYRARRRLAA